MSPGLKERQGGAEQRHNDFGLALPQEVGVLICLHWFCRFKWFEEIA